ncbi:MAG: hypothetical protein AAFN59_03650, partial [Pseudomonadota bacterium]
MDEVGRKGAVGKHQDRAFGRHLDIVLTAKNVVLEFPDHVASGAADDQQQVQDLHAEKVVAVGQDIDRVAMAVVLARGV